jgi:hypothetical protein
MKINLVKIDNNNYRLEVQPFEDDKLVNVYNLKRRELYDLFSQLRIQFPNED